MNSFERQNKREELSPKEKFQEKMREIPEQMPWVKGLIKVFYQPIFPFEPGKELAKIRGKIKKVPEGKQKQARREKTKKFEFKMIMQKIQLAKIQQKLEDFVEKNPDAQKKEILAQIKLDMNDARLDLDQRKRINSAVGIYVDRHGPIKKYVKQFQEKYPLAEDKEGEKSIRWQKELFKAIFNFEPKGKISLVVRPMLLFWRCFDVKVFARIYGCTLERANKVSGTILIGHKFGIPDLNEVIGLQNVSGLSDKQILQNLNHEKQHAIKEIIPEIRLPRKGRAIEKLSEKVTMEDLQTAISQDIRDEMYYYRTRAKDEILAYLTGDRPTWSIKSILLKKNYLYDYPKRSELAKTLEEKVKKKCSDCPNIRSMIETILKGRVKQYRRRVFLAAKAVRNLEKHFVRKDLIPLLTHEPMEKWPRLARLMAEALILKKEFEPKKKVNREKEIKQKKKMPNLETRIIY